MRQVTIKALARELRLSVSTISKALRDSHEISEATKRRVLELAARLEFTPNPYASSLRGRKSRNIAIVIPEVADSFFSLAINGITSVTKEKGYHSIICLTHEDYKDEQDILKAFHNGRVDGVLMSVSGTTESGAHIRGLMDQGVPVVLFDRVLPDVPAPKVVTDDAASARHATQLLLDRGCRRIAFLGLSPQLSISADRLAGYESVLRANGHRPKAKDILSCGSGQQQNLLAIKKLLRRNDRPDGIVAAVEKLAPLVYQACNDLSLRIPDDVKLICFSSLEIAGILQPSLSTITQPAFEMGAQAAGLLMKLMAGKRVEMEVVVEAGLTERASTG